MLGSFGNVCQISISVSWRALPLSFRPPPPSLPHPPVCYFPSDMYTELPLIRHALRRVALRSPRRHRVHYNAQKTPTPPQALFLMKFPRFHLGRWRLRTHSMPETGVWRFWTLRAWLEAPMAFVVTDGAVSRASPESPAGSNRFVFFF